MGSKALKRAYAVSLVTQGKWRFYTLTIPSDVLEKCCYVSARHGDEDGGFQRRLDRRRAQAIADYIDKDNGTIPNAVILSAQKDAQLIVTGRGKTIQFSQTSKAFLILDGQHRVYGYRLAKTILRVPVVVYNNLSKAEEVRLFTDINTKQRPVPNELLLDIQQMTGDESEENALLRSVFDYLNNDRNGPMFGLMAPHEKTPNKISRVTFNAAVKPLLARFRDNGDERVAEILSNYLLATRQQLPSRKSETLITNPTVFRALFELFPRVTQRVSDIYESDYSAENFGAVIESAISKSVLRALMNPGNSYKALGDKLVQKFDKGIQF